MGEDRFLAYPLWTRRVSHVDTVGMTGAQFSAAFARALRAARLEKGLSQEAVADAARVHPTYVSRVETGKIIPSIAVCYRLASAVGRTLSALVSQAEGRRDRG